MEISDCHDTDEWNTNLCSSEIHSMPTLIEEIKPVVVVKMWAV